VTFRLDVESEAWSPDSRRLTYWSGVDLRSVAVDGNGREDILVSETAAIPHGALHPVAWSADDRLLVLTAHALGKSMDVVILRDGKIVPLLDSRFNERAVALTPDGRWLAYASDETSRQELYVRDLADGGRKYGVTADGTDGWFTKQGRELIYIGRKGPFAMTFTPGTPPTLGKTEPLLKPAGISDLDNILSGSPAPDGGRIVAVYEKALPPLTEIRVVANWAQQLVERAGR
jgi:Tol biopolymer transport system component